MKSNKYLNQIAELIYNDIKKGKLGSNGTEPSQDNTGVRNPVANTESSIEKFIYENTVKFIYTYLNTQDSVSVAEIDFHNQDGENISLDVFPEITTSSNIDLVIEKTAEII